MDLLPSVKLTKPKSHSKSNDQLPLNNTSFDRIEMQDTEGRNVGYLVKCNLCLVGEMFPFKDKQAHDRLKEWLFLHEHKV